MAVAWAFEDEHTPGVLDALNRVTIEGAVAPSLWRLEVANAFRSATRRRRCDEAFADEALALLGRMLIEVDGDTHQRAWGDTLRLSRKHGLTPYDAAYLELALRRDCALATNDAGLKAAAGAYGIEILG